jgi:hypothetical protein
MKAHIGNRPPEEGPPQPGTNGSSRTPKKAGGAQ